MIIYKLTNKLNGKSYIGQTIRSLPARIKSHLNPKSHCIALISAIQKYGIENFETEVLVSASSIEELNDLESTYIQKYNTVSPHGYNLTTGGRNRAVSAETREKQSKSLKKFYASPEGKKLSQQRNIGRECSVATRAKISAANKGQVPWIKGKSWSKEYREERSRQQKGKTNVGRKMPESSKLLIGLASKGNSYALGYKHPPETLEKIRKASLEMHRKKKEAANEG